MIYYSDEEKIWKLDKITEHEKKLVMEVGTQFAMQLLGYAILKKLSTASLETIAPEEMGQA